METHRDWDLKTEQVNELRNLKNRELQSKPQFQENMRNEEFNKQKRKKVELEFIKLTEAKQEEVDKAWAGEKQGILRFEERRKRRCIYRNLMNAEKIIKKMNGNTNIKRREEDEEGRERNKKY